MNSENAPVGSERLIVDAHQHFWDLARYDFSWITPERSRLRRNFLPNDLKMNLQAHGVAKTVLVQAVPVMEESEFLLALARDHDFIAKVVGWVDFEHKDASEHIAHLSRNPKLVGLRPMLQAIEDTNWILHPALEPAIEAMLNTGLTFDALCTPSHLPALWEFAKRYPALPIVINHCAKPEIKAANLDQWHGDMSSIAQCRNVFCKLSGLTAKTAFDWDVSDLIPVYRAILDLFGPKRIMWASDWPVLLETARYSEWFEASNELMSALDDEQRADIMGRTARRFYKF